MIVQKESPDERALVALAAATTAVAIGIAVRAGTTRPVDRAVRSRVHPRRSPRIVKTAKAVSFLAGPKANPLFAIAVAASLSAWKRKLVVSPVIASVLAMAIDKGARFVIHQRRPPKAKKRSGRNRFAYPSGHTGAAAALAMTTALEISGGESLESRLVAYTAATIAGGAVGWSRLALDEHWIDDIVGGFAVGIAVAIGSVALSESHLLRRSTLATRFPSATRDHPLRP